MVENPNVSNVVTVKELLERHPQLSHMFLDMGMLCAGCPAEAFHTLAEVAQEYELDMDQLLRRINNNIRENASSE